MSCITVTAIIHHCPFKHHEKPLRLKMNFVNRQRNEPNSNQKLFPKMLKFSHGNVKILALCKISSYDMILSCINSSSIFANFKRFCPFLHYHFLGFFSFLVGTLATLNRSKNILQSSFLAKIELIFRCFGKQLQYYPFFIYNFWGFSENLTILNVPGVNWSRR